VKEFENRYQVTEALILSWGKGRRTRKHKISLALRFGSLFLSAGILGVGILVEQVSFFFPFGIALFLFCAYSIYVRPYIVFSKQLKEYSQLVGSQPWQRVITISDAIAINDNIVQTIYQWSFISNVDIYSDMIVLDFKNDFFRLQLYSDCFTIGTATEFIEFLKTDHPEIPIKSTASSSKSGEDPR
jgi:hypothetical protein